MIFVKGLACAIWQTGTQAERKACSARVRQRFGLPRASVPDHESKSTLRPASAGLRLC